MWKVRERRGGREVCHCFDAVARVTEHPLANPSNRPRLRPVNWRRGRPERPRARTPTPRPLAAKVEGGTLGERCRSTPSQWRHMGRISREGSLQGGFSTKSHLFGDDPGAEVRAPGRGQPRASACPRPREARAKRSAPQILVYTRRRRPKSWCIRAPPAMYASGRCPFSPGEGGPRPAPGPFPGARVALPGYHPRGEGLREFLPW